MVKCTFAFMFLVVANSCMAQKQADTVFKANSRSQPISKAAKAISAPLVTDLYTADPSVHVFQGKLYIYPSHDVDAGVVNDASGAQYAMSDYHVYSMNNPGGKVRDHGEVLNVNQVPWAWKQMWAPDAAERNGKYYLYFPARDKSGIFRIGVAEGSSPSGPFVPDDQPIANAFSIDPAVFKDDDTSYYLYFGGIRGGQLQNWQTGTFDSTGEVPTGDLPALMPRIARLSANMKEIAAPVREVAILDEGGQPLKASDEHRRFFEGAWVHKYKGKYYLSYSTGNTHKIVYGVGDNPYGPFTYQGVVLNPVIGWTNHQSIVSFKGKWYLFYHDSSLSGGKSFLRCVKMTELTYDAAGKIQTINAYKD